MKDVEIIQAYKEKYGNCASSTIRYRLEKIYKIFERININLEILSKKSTIALLVVLLEDYNNGVGFLDFTYKNLDVEDVGINFGRNAKERTESFKKFNSFYHRMIAYKNNIENNLEQETLKQIIDSISNRDLYHMLLKFKKFTDNIEQKVDVYEDRIYLFKQVADELKSLYDEIISESR